MVVEGAICLSSSTAKSIAKVTALFKPVFLISSTEYRK